jgi:hypothetical protein
MNEARAILVAVFTLDTVCETRPHMVAALAHSWMPALSLVPHGLVMGS